jgi:SAM-dependent methyltransferase
MAAPEYYRDILIRTAPGGHAAAFTLFQQAGLAAADPIIELGAGEGAFLARVQDAGYTHLSAVEIEPGRFRLDVPCHAVDLNGDFPTALLDPYAAVIAVEIIEHLENPAHFLRGCFQLVRPGGCLLLSTPNIAMAEGRLRFLRHGVLTRFTDTDITEIGHISPLPDNVLRHHIARAGWQVVARATNISRPSMDDRRLRGPWKLLWPPLLPLMKGESLGDMLIYLLRKPA